MAIQQILAAIEAEHSARRERDGGALMRRNTDDRIAEITKHLGFDRVAGWLTNFLIASPFRLSQSHEFRSSSLTGRARISLLQFLLHK